MVSNETMEILDYYEKHSKNWMEFERITPLFNKIKGSICLQHNKFYGSLVIEEVNGETAYQTIHGMPKLDYYNGHNPLICNSSNHIFVYEKLDGSNLLLYPLKDTNGEVLEVVPKSRNTPVAHKSLLQLWKKIDQKEDIENYIKKTEDILIFELYGYENPHEIKYTVPIDIGLLRGYDKYNKPLNDKQITEIKQKLRIIRPILFRETISMEKSFKDYYNHLIEVVNSHDSWIKEGIVLNGMSPEHRFRQLKLKRKEYYEKHKFYGGVPKVIIKKEVYKLFDTYTVNYENVEEDIDKYINEVIVNLKEDVDERYVEKPSTIKNIKNTIIQEVGKRSVNEDFKTLLTNLYNDNKDLEIQELMRIFGEKYPFLKNKSTKAYNTLKRLKQSWLLWIKLKKN